MDIFDVALLPELAVDAIVTVSLLLFSDGVVRDVLDSEQSFRSFTRALLSTEAVFSDLLVFAAPCNGMTKEASKFDDDDFSISASKSIIKSPIPVESGSLVFDVASTLCLITCLYPTRYLRIQNWNLSNHLDFLSSLKLSRLFYYFVFQRPPEIEQELSGALSRGVMSVATLEWWLFTAF